MALNFTINLQYRINNILHLVVISYGISTGKLSSFVRTWKDRTISSQSLNQRGRRKSWKHILRRSFSCNISLRNITLPVLTNLLYAFIVFSCVAIRKHSTYLTLYYYEISTSRLVLMHSSHSPQKSILFSPKYASKIW